MTPCNAFSTMSMVPKWGSIAGRSVNAVYTAGTNGYLIIQGQRCEAYINGHRLSNNSWEYCRAGQEKVAMFPVAKGQQYKCTLAADNYHGCWWVPAG